MEEKLGTKWMATVASIWIQCSVGATYTFGIYSPTLKSTQNYDQSTLATVSVFKDIGGCAGVLSGLLFSFVTLNHHSCPRFLRGPWVVHLAGAILFSAGYFLMWASVVGLIQRPPVPLMCLFIFMAAHAQTFFNTGNIVTGLMNFGDYGGTIVGILKGYLGLSGAVLITVYNTICRRNPSAYLLLLTLLPSIASLLLMCQVRIYGTSSLDDKKHLNAFSAVAVTLAAYFMPKERMQRKYHKHFPPKGNLLWTAVRQVAYDEMLDDDESREEAAFDDNTLNEGEDMNLLQAMCTGNFWLLCIAMLCGMGSGLATLNNISQVGQSLGYKTTEINSLVSAVEYMELFWSIWSRWSLMPTITSEIFGVGHMGTIFNTIGIASPVGSYICSVRIIGYVYDKVARGEDHSCYGTHCFMLSFLIMAAVALLGSLVAFLFFFRTSRFYGQLVLGKVAPAFLRR
ncbi:protein NUCLEAR FUSION DEFECTIVE 4-like [Melia azedarach]|uniref:Protein NUCLEAR FUSION DEFECTIVE 4-like n=1 Tax=Melia azedarach TaxID=155640 RepID=A0ACC1XLD5_MELAZ|nr:protein NUCLEAR FUSION DEFECTIVE 4-like [Melia azedarach]